MKSTLPPPLPGTCHPTFTLYERPIREALPDTHEIVVASTPNTPELRLSVYVHSAPAPFVGDPVTVHGAYMWRSAQDDLGRSVAGDAELILMSQEEPRPRRGLLRGWRVDHQ